jgi:hypothetical protein
VRSQRRANTSIAGQDTSAALGIAAPVDPYAREAIRAAFARDRELRVAALRARFAETASDLGARPFRPRRSHEL